MPLKIAGIDDSGNLPARFETRLAALLTQARSRANHTGTQDAATTLSGLAEAVQDIMALTLVPGLGISLNYNDVANTLTITNTGTSGPGGVDPEGVRDVVGAALSGVGLITVNVNDPGDVITISTNATQNSTDAQLRDRSTHTGLTPLAAMGTGTPASGRYVDGGTQAWTDLPTGSGGTTTDASLLTTGTLPPARIGNASIVDAKLASGTALTPAERTKLTGIAPGATANRTDAATDALLAEKAPLASPALTGTPTVNGDGIVTQSGLQDTEALLTGSIEAKPSYEDLRPAPPWLLTSDFAIPTANNTTNVATTLARTMSTPNAMYLFEITILFDLEQAADYVFRLLAPTGATLSAVGTGAMPASGTFAGAFVRHLDHTTTSSSATMQVGGGSATDAARAVTPVYVRGVCTLGATTGDLVVTGRHVVAGTFQSYIRTGSMFVLERCAAA
jgi:hypothetical protein